MASTHFTTASRAKAIAAFKTKDIRIHFGQQGNQTIKSLAWTNDTTALITSNSIANGNALYVPIARQNVLSTTAQAALYIDGEVFDTVFSFTIEGGGSTLVDDYIQHIREIRLTFQTT